MFEEETEQEQEDAVPIFMEENDTMPITPSPGLPPPEEVNFSPKKKSFQFIPVCEPTLQGNEMKYVQEAVQSGWISSAGKFIIEFEEKFAAYCHVKHGVSCSSGTAALHMAIKALGIGKGDEVIVPSFSMAASSNAVVYSGAKPVFVDSELETWNMDLKDVKRKITGRTKAVMVVHTYGHPVDMDRLREITDRFGLPIIEDAAEAHGAEYKGRKIGSLGDIACFSFYANKIITCFPPETKILVKPPLGGRGLSRMKKIKDLKVGDVVLTYDVKTSVKEYKKITRTFERDYEENLINLFFSNKNTLSLTPNHPIYIINKGWIRADKLEVGDEVIQYNYRGLAYKGMYKGETYELIMGKKVALRKRKAHAVKIAAKHKDPVSGYATVDRVAVAQKIGKANKGKKRSEKDKRKLKKIQRLRWKNMGAEKYAAICRKIKEVNSDPEMRKRKSEIAKKMAQDPEYLKKVSLGVRRAMKKESYWKNYTKGMNMKPNKPEQFLLSFLEEHFPGEFGYNGDYRLKTRIDRLIPDFVHINGKKKLIDVLGSYWHADNEYYERAERYKKHGYDSLILWEKELKNIPVLKEKIKTFIYNPNVKVVRVVKISQEEYKGKVYNIETEKNHNYFAYGILVHNCGEGGMVVTNNLEWAERCRKLRNHFFGEPRFLHQEIGFNYRLTNVQAAIGLAQMERIDDYVEARRKNAYLYNQLLRGVLGIILPPEKEWAKNVYWMYGILIDEEKFGMNMLKLAEELKKREIDTRTFFIGLHKQPMYQIDDSYVHDKEGAYPGVDELERKGLYLPSSSHLTEEQIRFIVETIKEIQRETKER